MSTEIASLFAKVGADISGLKQGLGSARNMLTDAGAQMAKVGAGLTLGLTVPLMAVGTAAMKAATDFDRELRNIQSISKESDASIAALGDTFLKMSQDLNVTRDSAVNLAAGFYQIQSSGFAGVDAMTVLEASTKAASAGLTTTEVTAKTITAVLNAYGMQASEAAHVSDVLFKSVDVGVFSFEEIAGAIGDTLGTAAAAGVPLEELAAAFATITKSGINVNEAATSINQLMLSYISPSKEALEAAKAMGIQLNAEALSAEGLSGVINELATHTQMWTAVATNADGPLKEQLSAVEASQEALKRWKLELQATGQWNSEANKSFQQQAAALQLQKMDVMAAMEANVDYVEVMNDMAESTGLSVEQLAALFPNVRALRGALSLAREGGAAFAQDLEMMAGAAGATTAAFEIQTKSWAAQLDNFKNVGTAVLIELGQQFMPTFLEILQGIQGVVGWLKEGNPEWARWAVVIGGVLAALGPALTIVGALVSAIGFLLTPVGLVVGALGLLGLAFATNFGGLRDLVLGALQPLQAAVETVVPRLVAVFNQMVDWWNDNGPGIEAIVGRVFGKLAEVAANVSNTVVPVLVEQFEKVADWFTKNGPLIQDYLSRLADIFDVIADAVIRAMPIVTAILGGTLGVVLELVEAFLQVSAGDTAGALESLGQAGTKLLDALGNVGVAFADFVAGFFGTDWATIVETWRTNWEMFKVIAAELWEQLKTKAGELWAAIVTGVQQFVADVAAKWEEAKAGWITAWEALRAIPGAIWERIKEAASQALANLLEKMGIPDILQRWSAIWADIQLIVSMVWARIKETVATKIEEARAAIEEKLNIITTFWAQVWEGIRAKAAELWALIKTHILTPMDETKTSLQEKLEQVRVAWAEKWEAIKTKVAEQWAAIVTEVKTRVGAVKTEVEKGINQVLTWLGEKVQAFKDAGKNLLLGLRDGILNSVGALVNAITTAVESAIAQALALLEEHSPSRVFFDIGENTMKGMAMGISAGAGMPQVALAGAYGPMTAAPAGGGGNTYHFEIDARGATMNADEFEAVVRRVMQERDREIDGRRRTGG